MKQNLSRVLDILVMSTHVTCLYMFHIPIVAPTVSHAFPQGRRGSDLPHHRAGGTKKDRYIISGYHWHTIPIALTSTLSTSAALANVFDLDQVINKVMNKVNYLECHISATNVVFNYICIIIYIYVNDICVVEELLNRHSDMLKCACNCLQICWNYLLKHHETSLNWNYLEKWSTSTCRNRSNVLQLPSTHPLWWQLPVYVW